MNDNYIMLNGKRVDLTDEQIEKLGLKVEEKTEEKKDCFKKEYPFYFIAHDGKIHSSEDTDWYNTDDDLFAVANCCTDKSLIQQRALHETLSRLLWRFSMQNEGDKISWNNTYIRKYYIYFDYECNEFGIDSNIYFGNQGVIYFNSEDIAQKAIDEIVRPFMKELPDFIW